MKRTLLFLILSMLAFSVPVFAEDEAATPASASLCDDNREAGKGDGQGSQVQDEESEGQEAIQD